MTAGAARWSDLQTRILSGIVLAALAVGAIWSGGLVFIGFVAALALAVTWEQARVFDAGQVWMAPLTAAIAFGLGLVMPGATPVLVLASALVFAGSLASDRVLAGLSHAIALLGAIAFLRFAGTQGTQMLVWLIGIVVLTDIGGYFGGRLIGGPKIWPAVSPKKTWSGTVTGWAAAALFTVFFPGTGAYGPWLIFAAVVLSAASQAGDLFESHIKRRRGVKDSSNLIPGHGGVWDRFDGMLTAAIAAWIVTAL